MSVLYRSVLRKNPLVASDPGKYYPSPVYRGKMQLRQIAKEISERTSLNSTDTMAVLEALTQVIPDLLSDGFIVGLGDFGSYRLTFKSVGEDVEKDVSASNIKGLSVKFFPGSEFKNHLATVKAEKEKG